MSKKKLVKNLNEFLIAQSAELPLQQQRLDYIYLEELQAYKSFLEQARELGYESLAKSLPPAATIIEKTEIESKFRFAKEEGKEFSICIRTLNLSYTKRFSYLEFSENSLNITIQRVPFSQKDEQKTRRTNHKKDE